jgi:hypothetical protein
MSDHPPHMYILSKAYFGGVGLACGKREWLRYNTLRAHHGSVLDVLRRDDGRNHPQLTVRNMIKGRGVNLEVPG